MSRDKVGYEYLGWGRGARYFVSVFLKLELVSLFFMPNNIKREDITVHVEYIHTEFKKFACPHHALSTSLASS